jgi:hypothetical protein
MLRQCYDYMKSIQFKNISAQYLKTQTVDTLNGLL